MVECKTVATHPATDLESAFVVRGDVSLDVLANSLRTLLYT